MDLEDESGSRVESHAYPPSMTHLTFTSHEQSSVRQDEERKAGEKLERQNSDDDW